ncbi:MAG: tRNA 2-thiouridine(34) synthase MnmA, partial [Eubacteriaceae bacterium]|nr:tRNA 2-thiouridine(34) synthase MnmA [Eubacteriaceae bacterium]
KDQSYFLCSLTSEQAAAALFPVGGMMKSEVRKIAAGLGLRTAEKKDSTGVCFIGERNFKKFLMDYLPAMPGDIVDADSGKVIGSHDGLMYYTIGQRRGLGIGNMGGGERWFVCGKDMDRNVLLVCEGASNPLLFSEGFYSEKLHLVNPVEGSEIRCMVKYRYRQQERAATLFRSGEGARVVFDEPQSGLAPGQSGVFYLGDELIGSAVIDSVMEN